MMSVADRFWEKVDRHGPDDCWEWRGPVRGVGYGGFYFNGAAEYAHRFAYQLTHGSPPPDGMDIDHLCRNRLCCNPAHLEAVTHQENIRRGDTLPAMNAAKTHCVNGHPFAGRNLHVLPSGARRCRACNAAASERQRAKRRGTVAA